MRLQSNCLIMKVISILEVLIKRLNYGLLNPKKKFVLFPTLGYGRINDISLLNIEEILIITERHI